MKSTSCDECEAIILEYRRACIEFWLNSSEETRDACRAIGQLVAGCREADAAHAEELLRPFKPLTFESKMNRRAGLLEAYVGSDFDPLITDSGAGLSQDPASVQKRSLRELSILSAPGPLLKTRSLACCLAVSEVVRRHRLGREEGILHNGSSSVRPLNFLRLVREIVSYCILSSDVF
jgi:hypothetical protein